MSRWIVPLLSKISSSHPGNAVFIALATLDEGHLVIIDDPTGFLSSLAKKSHKTPEQVLEECIQCARNGILVGRWRFFIVDEILLGKRQQRIIASPVAYRARIPISELNDLKQRPGSPDL